jgi:hypothetical protein
MLFFLSTLQEHVWNGSLKRLEQCPKYRFVVLMSYLTKSTVSPIKVQWTRCTSKKIISERFSHKILFSFKQKSFKSSFYFFNYSKIMLWKCLVKKNKESSFEIIKMVLNWSWTELDEFSKLCKIRCILEDYHQTFHNCSSNRSSVIKRHWKRKHSLEMKILGFTYNFIHVIFGSLLIIHVIIFF